MSLDGTYEDGNIFAKILRGEMPCAKVFEDGEVFAFMDVFPQSRGHSLVIPNFLPIAPAVLSTAALAALRDLPCLRRARRSGRSTSTSEMPRLVR